MRWKNTTDQYGALSIGLHCLIGFHTLAALFHHYFQVTRAHQQRKLQKEYEKYWKSRG